MTRKGLDWSQADLDAAVRAGKVKIARGQKHTRLQPGPVLVPRGRARGQHRRGVMNETEAAYAREVLDPLMLAGVVARYLFEPLKLLLEPPIAAEDSDDGKRVPGVWYEPDYLVTLQDGLMEMHEVKGTRGKGVAKKVHWEDDSRRVWKLVAAMFPEFVFRAVWKDSHGTWREEIRP